MILPVVQGRNPGYIFERFVEMRNMLESDLLSYGMYLLTGCPEQLLRFTDADYPNVLANMEAGQLQKDAA